MKVNGQYLGGNGSGVTVSVLSGSCFFNSLYNGGVGRGDGNSNLMGTNLFNAPFTGGNGRGDVATALTATNFFNSPFLGGTGRGDASVSVPGAAFFGAPYFGGNGRGDASFAYSGNTFFSGLYWGGNGRGDSYSGKLDQMFGCTASISADGATTFCQGGSVNLSASTGVSYLWSTSETTSTIHVVSGGNYSVQVTNLYDCHAFSDPTTVTVNICALSLYLKLFIEGMYRGNGTMIAALDPVSMPTVCDSITVELHQPVSPYPLTYSVSSVIDINGNGSFVFPGSVFGNSYYLVVRHRNSIELWSKNPVLFNSTSINFDFTTP